MLESLKLSEERKDYRVRIWAERQVLEESIKRRWRHDQEVLVAGTA
jgi:hypothetical protein